MIDPAEKSTEVAATAEVASGMWLDGRLGLYHEEQSWLAVADLHYGYEMSRRAAGGLWPMWGMETVEKRLKSLVNAHKPKTLILVGDIVDGRTASEDAIIWLSGLHGLCEEVVFVEGNHDRGEVKRHFDFVPWHRTDGFFFHHGHRRSTSQQVRHDEIEITGHLHPSVNLSDGAGTRLRLPALAMDIAEDAPERWTLPAFSPWAGGCRYEPACESSRCRMWACNPKRVFETLA